MTLKPGDIRVPPRCRIAHIVTSCQEEIWHGEAMSVCGRLLLEDDRLPTDKNPICEDCQRKEMK